MKKIYKTRELPKWSKVKIDDKEYIFLWMDWMYWRFQNSKWEVGFCYADFEKDWDCFICIE